MIIWGILLIDWIIILWCSIIADYDNDYCNLPAVTLTFVSVQLSCVPPILVEGIEETSSNKFVELHANWKLLVSKLLEGSIGTLILAMTTAGLQLEVAGLQLKASYAYSVQLLPAGMLLIHSVKLSLSLRDILYTSWSTRASDSKWLNWVKTCSVMLPLIKSNWRHMSLNVILINLNCWSSWVP